MDLKIIVGIPTVRRATILCETLRELALQTIPPDGVIVCGAEAGDLEEAAVARPDAQLILTKPGLARQRNAILDAAGAADVVLFFDDDFLPYPGYLRAIAAAMGADRDIVVATGALIANAINGPGLSADEGRAILATSAQTDPAASWTETIPVFTGYGCNMAVRLAHMRANGLVFDERLPLYGWQEDVDFSRRAAAFGSVVKVLGARGVHLGVKLGRSSGVRLGYSQVANPIYLAGKHLGYPLRRAITHIASNIAINVVRSAWSESYVDRRGRLQGNLLAIRDLLIGRMTPENMLNF